MPGVTYIALIVLLPLFSFLLTGIAGRVYFKNACGLLANLTIGTSFALAVWVAWQYFSAEGWDGEKYNAIIPLRFAWLPFTETYSIDMGLLIDPISVMMILVVTFVSLMVHIYSLGYMQGDERKAVFFTYLSLFTFSMLGLVLSSNLFQMYIFWELVGVSSYLLIGFYYTKPSAVAAAKKAFIVTRFADFGFLVGILILSYQTGTFDFITLIERATDPLFMESMAGLEFMGLSVITWGLLLVFMGGAGKSAMFPLHIWLPDAMEGPTPVSALIHAATMVVAGVFLVARLFPVFHFSCPAALEVVTWVGVFSSFLAAVIACTQTDIKRVLAYSTMSQIGFMMFALGVSGYYGESAGGYVGSMFHLFTHAMFKALLFLGAGAVIHYVHSNEMKDMGGLRKFMPVTHILFLIACLAIAGVPPFAGFFSKEEILLAAYTSHPAVYAMALFTSALTAFYMFRLYFSIFWNKDFVAHNHVVHTHKEAPGLMLFPMIILGVLSVVAGWVPFGNFVSPSGEKMHMELHIMFSLAPILLALTAMLTAMVMYRKQNSLPQLISQGMRGLYTTALHTFYIDEVYRFVTHKIIFKWIGRPAAWMDRNVVDGFMNAMAALAVFVSFDIKHWQSGRLQDYALYFITSVIGLTLLILYLL